LEQNSPIRVVVGEDQPLFRAGVVHVLRDAGFDVVGVAADAKMLVAKARAHAPEVAVIDIQMPPGLVDDGLRAALEIRSGEPAIAVLILSQFLEDRYAIELLGEHPGGVGYLLKDRLANVDSFVDAVRRVVRGESVVDPEVVARLVRRRRGHDPIGQLTPRERDVVAVMAQGRSNQGIAEALVVTESAVERHVTSIFSKLDLPQHAGDHRRVLAVLQYLRLNGARRGVADGPAA
jgi:DNA-binding NarL/FixJ family response regulator